MHIPNNNGYPTVRGPPRRKGDDARVFGVFAGTGREFRPFREAYSRKCEQLSFVEQRLRRIEGNLNFHVRSKWIPYIY